jgi:membrane fusion protein, multidrug efflux system
MVPNPDGDLLPGMYVRVQIQQGVEKNAIAIPQQAVQRSNSGQSQVYVVNAENKVEFRNIMLGRTVGNRWMVTDGLKAGEKVIVEGFQKIGPGAQVIPAEWDPNGKPASEAGAAQSAQAEAGKGGTAAAAPADGEKPAVEQK